MAKTMRALQLTRPSPAAAPSLALQDVPVPEILPDHALVKIHASSITPSDLLNTKGGFPTTSYPRVPGRDFSGVVVDGPTELLNASVFATSGPQFSFSLDGSHAEYAVVPLELLAPKPANISHVQAASIGVPFTTAAIILRRADVRPGETVLVLGATGSVGSAVVQMAKAKGCKVLAASRGDGPGTDVNLKADPGLRGAKEVRGLAGNGPDVVVDTTGDLGLISNALAVLGPWGRLVYIATPRSGSTNIQLDLLSHYRLQHSLVGCNSLAWGEKEVGDMLREVASLVGEGKLKVASEEGFEKFGIEQGVEAYEKFADKSVRKPMFVFE